MQKLIRFWQNLRLRAKFLLILLVGIVPVLLFRKNEKTFQKE